MNVPAMSKLTHKYHERLLVPIQGITSQSLDKSVKEERKRTLENSEEIKNFWLVP